MAWVAAARTALGEQLFSFEAVASLVAVMVENLKGQHESGCESNV